MSLKENLARRQYGSKSAEFEVDFKSGEKVVKFLAKK
jgi:hypothetical protein